MVRFDAARRTAVVRGPYDVAVDPLARAIDALIQAGRRLGAGASSRPGRATCRSASMPTGCSCTPTGLRKDELTPDDLVIVWLGHEEREAVSRSGRGPTSDLAIHLAVHAARPDISAVAHAHLPASMGLTLAGEVPDPAALPETALLLPRLPYLGLGVPGSEELAGRVAAALSDPGEPPGPLASAVLLERHGAVAVGRDPAHAVDRLELVEVLCRTWRDAILVRGALAATAIVAARSEAPAQDDRRRDG